MTLQNVIKTNKKLKIFAADLKKKKSKLSNVLQI